MSGVGLAFPDNNNELCVWGGGVALIESGWSHS